MLCIGENVCTADIYPIQVLVATFAGWMNRKQADVLDYLVEENHDRDTKFSLRFRIVLEDAGIEPIKTPFQAPNANAYAERFVRSIKEECLDRMILFGEGHMRRAIEQYLEHYHAERNHQGLGNELIDGEVGTVGEIVSRDRLGGTLRYYYRAA